MGELTHLASIPSNLKNFVPIFGEKTKYEYVPLVVTVDTNLPNFLWFDFLKFVAFKEISFNFAIFCSENRPAVRGLRN